MYDYLQHQIELLRKLLVLTKTFLVCGSMDGHIIKLPNWKKSFIVSFITKELRYYVRTKKSVGSNVIYTDDEFHQYIVKYRESYNKTSHTSEHICSSSDFKTTSSCLRYSWSVNRWINWLVDSWWESNLVVCIDICMK